MTATCGGQGRHFRPRPHGMPLACMHPPPTSRSCNVCKLGGWRPSPPSKTCSSAETRCYWTPSVNDHPLRPAFRNVPCSRPAAPNGVAAAFLTLQTRPLQLTVAAAGRGRAPTSLQIRANTFDKNCWPGHAPFAVYIPIAASANPERIPDAPATVEPHNLSSQTHSLSRRVPTRTRLYGPEGCMHARQACNIHPSIGACMHMPPETRNTESWLRPPSPQTERTSASR